MRKRIYKSKDLELQIMKIGDASCLDMIYNRDDGKQITGRIRLRDEWTEDRFDKFFIDVFGKEPEEIK